jgi:hypothetical protein
MAGIEDWLPTFHVGERHQIDVALPAEQALRQALAAPAAPDRVVRLLFRLRGLQPDGSIQQFMARNGFTVLEHTTTTYVVGLVARGRRLPLADPAAWRAAALPRTVKIAADFRAEPAPGGSRLITETRVSAADAPALLRFRLYWLLVGPFSKLIRRRWLRAAAGGPGYRPTFSPAVRRGLPPGLHRPSSVTASVVNVSRRLEATSMPPHVDCAGVLA